MTTLQFHKVEIVPDRWSVFMSLKLTDAKQKLLLTGLVTINPDTSTVMEPLPGTSSRVHRFRSQLSKSRPHRLKLPLIKVCQDLDTLFSIAVAYFNEKQSEKALRYFLRFVDAALVKFPKHPNYSDITNEYKEQLCRQTIYAIKLVEQLKSEILSSHSNNLKDNIDNVQ